MQRLRAVQRALVVSLLFLLPVRAGGDEQLPIIFEQQGLVPQAKVFLTERAAEIRRWASDKAVMEAVLRQNRNGPSLEEIKKLDQRWIAGKSAPGFEQSLRSNDCAAALRHRMASAAKDTYREAFVTDTRGAVVCETERTSDFWQADEPKWEGAYNDGHGAIYVGAVSLDESVGQPLVQIAVPVMDGDKAIGVLIVGKTVRDLQHGQKLERRPSPE